LRKKGGGQNLVMKAASSPPPIQRDSNIYSPYACSAFWFCAELLLNSFPLIVPFSASLHLSSGLHPPFQHSFTSTGKGQYFSPSTGRNAEKRIAHLLRRVKKSDKITGLAEVKEDSPVEECEEDLGERDSPSKQAEVTDDLPAIRKGEDSPSKKGDLDLDDSPVEEGEEGEVLPLVAPGVEDFGPDPLVGGLCYIVMITIKGRRKPHISFTDPPHITL
jgi:hypothetical protein